MRKWAEGLGLPFFGLRAVSDTADEAVDPLVQALKFSPRPVQLAAKRANPSSADCLDMEHQLLLHKAELIGLRADAAGQARGIV